MKPRLIQTARLGQENKAEREVLNFLEWLPETYTIFRELRVSRDYEERVRGMEKVQPDFVVLGEAIGLLAIEVKDWNLTRNEYMWCDQETVVKKTLATGEEEPIDNPAAQAEKYRYALMALVRDTGIFVTSLVAFPRLSRNEFLNRLGNLEVLQNPQSKFYLDLQTVIFKDDIDQFLTEPERLLTQLVRKRSNFRSATANQVQSVMERLLPNSIRVGSVTDRQKKRIALSMISADQEKWIFNLDRTTNYLLDVAGSGKTNVLVSRAVHIIDQAYKKKQSPPQILLTTYNPNLARNIEQILAGKIKPAERQTRYRTLRVADVTYIMERIATTGYGLKSRSEYYALNSPDSPNYHKTLYSDVEAELNSHPDKYRQFDYVFIDEIQDFDDTQLYLIRCLCKTDNFFFVGDIGQKIYERYHDLKRHGFIIEELELPKSYKMYRTPRYIGKLAHKFITADTALLEEFKQHGYRQDAQFCSYSDNAAELLYAPNVIEAVVERVEDFLAGSFVPRDLMVVTSPQKLPLYKAAFAQANLQVSIGEPQHSDEICLIDFMNVKGLEREVVFVTGIEDLYNRSSADGMFDDPATQIKQERFSRRKIYVALTRAIEECIVYYSDPTNVFVSELIALNRKITTERHRSAR